MIEFVRLRAKIYVLHVKIYVLCVQGKKDKDKGRQEQCRSKIQSFLLQNFSSTLHVTDYIVFMIFKLY